MVAGLLTAVDEAAEGVGAVGVAGLADAGTSGLLEDAFHLVADDPVDPGRFLGWEPVLAAHGTVVEGPFPPAPGAAEVLGLGLLIPGRGGLAGRFLTEPVQVGVTLSEVQHVALHLLR